MSHPGSHRGGDPSGKTWTWPWTCLCRSTKSGKTSASQPRNHRMTNVPTVNRPCCSGSRDMIDQSGLQNSPCNTRNDRMSGQELSRPTVHAMSADVSRTSACGARKEKSSAPIAPATSSTEVSRISANGARKERASASVAPATSRIADAKPRTTEQGGQEKERRPKDRSHGRPPRTTEGQEKERTSRSDRHPNTGQEELKMRSVRASSSTTSQPFKNNPVPTSGSFQPKTRRSSTEVDQQFLLRPKNSRQSQRHSVSSTVSTSGAASGSTGTSRSTVSRQTPPTLTRSRLEEDADILKEMIERRAARDKELKVLDDNKNGVDENVSLETIVHLIKITRTVFFCGGVIGYILFLLFLCGHVNFRSRHLSPEHHVSRYLRNSSHTKFPARWMQKQMLPYRRGEAADIGRKCIFFQGGECREKDFI